MEEPHITPETSTTTMNRTSESGSIAPSRPGSARSLGSGGDHETIQLAINLEARLTLDFNAQSTPVGTSSAEGTINEPDQELYPDIPGEKQSLELGDDLETLRLAVNLGARLTIDFEAQFNEFNMGTASAASTINESEEDSSPSLPEDKRSREKADIPEEKDSSQEAAISKEIGSQQTELGGELDNPVYASNLTTVDPDLVTWLVVSDPSATDN